MIIKLKDLISEVKKLDLNKVEDAAEYLIRSTWKVMPKSDRYSNDQVLLWLNNDQQLARELDVLASKFFANSDEPAMEFTDIINKKLDQMHHERNQKIARKLDLDDPLLLLKKIVMGKTWEGAKQSLVKQSLGGRIYRGGKLQDEEAEEIFNRLYRNAMGETVYSEQGLNKNYGRLSDLEKKPIDDTDPDSFRKNSINMFIDYKTGFKGNRFPEKVKVYRGVNSPNAKIRPGDYVTFDKAYAESYVRGKYGTVVSDILPSKDLIVDKVDLNMSEMVYWPEGHVIKKYEGTIPTFKEFWETWR